MGKKAALSASQSNQVLTALLSFIGWQYCTPIFQRIMRSLLSGYRRLIWGSKLGNECGCYLSHILGKEPGKGLLAVAKHTHIAIAFQVAQDFEHAREPEGDVAFFCNQGTARSR